MTTSFYFETPVKLENRKLLKKFLNTIVSRETTVLNSITFVFCSDEYLLNINNHFLNHNYYTDIITFELNEGRLKNGEIYISCHRVRDNAISYKLPLKDELHRVIFHGVLHLCGYKDKSKDQKEKMRKKEDFYLNRYKSFLLQNA